MFQRCVETTFDTQIIHHRKLTWNLKMMVSNRNLLFQGVIFRCHVSFQGCTQIIPNTCFFFGASMFFPSGEQDSPWAWWVLLVEVRGIYRVGFAIWMFPKIGVPQNGWFIMENPIKMDDLEVPLFSETSICPRGSMYCLCTYILGCFFFFLL